MRKWMMTREGFLLYTINSSLNPSSDFLAFQRHRHHEGESSHSKFTQVLQCTWQDSFLTGFYLQRSVPVGQAPLEAAPFHSDLCFPAQKRQKKGFFGDPPALPANSVSKLLHQCHYTMGLLPYFILF